MSPLLRRIAVFSSWLLGLALIVGSDLPGTDRSVPIYKVTVTFSPGSLPGRVFGGDIDCSVRGADLVDGQCSTGSDKPTFWLRLSPAPGGLVTRHEGCSSYTEESGGLGLCTITRTPDHGPNFPIRVQFSSAAIAPTISQPPQNSTVAVGATASFSVVASGTAPLSYRWQRNGADITGAADTATFTTAPVSAMDDGESFAVVVTNAAGSVTSASAILSVGHGWRGVGGAVVGVGSQRPRLAVDSAGLPFVVYQQLVAAMSRLFVRRFDGANWINVGANAGDPLDPAASNGVGESALIIGADDRPIVAWTEGPRVRVARWTGASWDFIGNDISIDLTDELAANGVQLARHGDDIVVSWIESVLVNGVPQMHIVVKRRGAAAGVWTGDYVTGVGDANQLRMALDATGRAVIAYAPRTSSGNELALRAIRETATGWEQLGDVGPAPPTPGAAARVHGFDVKMDAGDAPVVIGSVNGTELFAFRYSAAAWQPLGGMNGVFVALAPATEQLVAMAYVRDDPRILMAHTRQELPATGSARYVTEFMAWDGMAWLPLATPAAVTELSADLSPAIANGQPIFAAEYRLSRIVVQRFVP